MSGFWHDLRNPVADWAGAISDLFRAILPGMPAVQKAAPFLLLGMILVAIYYTVLCTIMYNRPRPKVEPLDDHRTDFNLCRNRAEKGDAPAQYELAQRYRTGKGTPPSETEARKWLASAAEQGHAKAREELGNG